MPVAGVQVLIDPALYERFANFLVNDYVIEGGAHAGLPLSVGTVLDYLSVPSHPLLPSHPCPLTHCPLRC